MTTAPAGHSTGYHESPWHLRRQLRAASAEWESRIGDGDALDPAAMMAASYAYVLAALLGWVGREHGPDAEHAAACMVDDVLTNGDCDDLNGDLRRGEAGHAPDGQA